MDTGHHGVGNIGNAGVYTSTIAARSYVYISTICLISFNMEA
jgi:hypothetical protein